MQEYGISLRFLYIEIDDRQLGDLVGETRAANPSCGSKMLVGYLGARGTFVPRYRIREAL